MPRAHFVEIPMALPGDDLDAAEDLLHEARRAREESAIRSQLAQALDALGSCPGLGDALVAPSGRINAIPQRVRLVPVNAGETPRLHESSALVLCKQAIERFEEIRRARVRRDPRTETGSLIGTVLSASKPHEAARAVLSGAEFDDWTRDMAAARGGPAPARAHPSSARLPAWSGCRASIPLPMRLPGEGGLEPLVWPSSDDDAKKAIRLAETRLAIARAYAMFEACPTLPGATFVVSKDGAGEPCASLEIPSGELRLDAAARAGLSGLSSFLPHALSRCRPGVARLASFHGKSIHRGDPDGAARLLLSDEQYAAWLSDWEARALRACPTPGPDPSGPKRV